MRVADATGFVTRFDEPPRRIVSLVPSLTEAIFAFGEGHRVVAITRFCEEPATAVAALPKVGGTKNPDIDTIVALAPDMVMASLEENREPDVAALRAAGLAVLVTHYPSVMSAVEGMWALAKIVGTDPAGHDWLTDAVHEVASRRDTVPRTVPYFCPIWRRPYMVARCDTYMADLLRLAGGVSVFPDEGEAHYFPVDLARLRRTAAAIILLPDEPFRFAPRHMADFLPFGDVPAVSHENIHFVDGKALTWYGPRTGPALRMFTELLAAPPPARSSPHRRAAPKSSV